MINKNMICFKCLGCNKLEDLKFYGLKVCKDFKSDNREDKKK
jgi:hypothetical protein